MMTVKTNGSSSNYEDQYGVESNFDTTQLWASQEEKTLRRNGSYLSLNKLKRFSIFHSQLTYTYRTASTKGSNLRLSIKRFWNKHRTIDNLIAVTSNYVQR